MRRPSTVPAGRRTDLRVAVPAVAAALVLTACGGDDPVAAPTTAPPTTAPPTTAAPGSAPAGATPSGGPGCPLLAAPPNGATVVRVTVTGKRIDTPSRTVDVKLGSTVRLEVVADVADEVHVHTYDERVETVPNCPVVLDFEARIPGTVEVELEKAHLHLVEIKAS